MNPLTFLLFTLSTASVALGLNYKGQEYQATIQTPNSTTPWYTGGYNTIDVVVIQTLICCPPLPPVRWVLKNADPSVLSEPLKIASASTFDAPENPDILNAPAGKNYILSVELDEAPYGSFGESEPFEIIDGAMSPPIVAPSKSNKPSATSDSGEPSHTAVPPTATLPGSESDSSASTSAAHHSSGSAVPPNSTVSHANESTTRPTSSVIPSSSSPVAPGGAGPQTSQPGSAAKIAISCAIAFGAAAAIGAFVGW